MDSIILKLKDLLGDVVKNSSFELIKHRKGWVVYILLERDKHAFIKRKLEANKLNNVFSVFVVVNKEKVFCVYGNPKVFMFIGQYRYILQYPDLDIYNKREEFYKELSFLVYKNRTKNAIVIGTHSGIIPILIHDKINRIYAVDTSYEKVNLAKQNIAENKIHNVLGFYGKTSKVIKDILNGVAPGKQHHISIVVSNDSLDTDDINSLLELKPISFILYGERDKVSKLVQLVEKTELYSLDRELIANNIFISRVNKKKEA